MAKTAMKTQPRKPAPEQAPVVHQDLSATTEQAPAVEAPKGRKARKDLYASYNPVSTDVIRIVPGGKAKKAGSIAAAMFALYTDGMTVGDLLAKAKEAKLKRGHSLQWDIKHNLITVGPAS